MFTLPSNNGKFNGKFDELRITKWSLLLDNNITHNLYNGQLSWDRETLSTVSFQFREVETISSEFIHLDGPHFLRWCFLNLFIICTYLIIWFEGLFLFLSFPTILCVEQVEKSKWIIESFSLQSFHYLYLQLHFPLQFLNIAPFNINTVFIFRPNNNDWKIHFETANKIK